MRKAQAAMEFFQQYAWVIIIIGIVLGALYYLGVFNIRPSSQCQVSIGFRCTESVWSVQNNSVQAGLVLRSTEDKSIILAGYSLQNATGACEFTPAIGQEVATDSPIKVDCTVAATEKLVVLVDYRRIDGVFNHAVPVYVKG